MLKIPKNWWRKSMKIQNIDRESLHIFWTSSRISMKFSGKMGLMIISHKNVTIEQDLTLSLEDFFLENQAFG